MAPVFLRLWRHNFHVEGRVPALTSCNLHIAFCGYRGRVSVEAKNNPPYNLEVIKTYKEEQK